MYRYSPKILENIALNYRLNFYTSVPENALQMTSLIESKADFDISLDGIGHGVWLEVAEKMRNRGLTIEEMEIDLWKFGNMQKTVIAEMLVIENDTLTRRYHIDEPEALRYKAFERMTDILNRGA